MFALKLHLYMDMHCIPIWANSQVEIVLFFTQCEISFCIFVIQLCGIIIHIYDRYFNSIVNQVFCKKQVESGNQL